MIRTNNILGTGTYLPVTKVESEVLDRKLGKPEGWVRKKIRIEQRFYANEDETSSMMGAKAIEAALLATNGIKAQDLQLIICASSVAEQLIPATSVLIQKNLGLENEAIPCFDINSTCLSFVTALDLASTLIASGQYRYIAIVSSEIASKGLNWNQTETCSLFGDGAAAVILGPASTTQPSGILGSYMRTFSSGATFCQVKAGGTRFNMITPPPQPEDYLFEMHGRRLFKLTAEKLHDFIPKLIERAGILLEEIDVIIPHQASPRGLDYLHEKLYLPEEKIVKIIKTHGNQVAASIPTALHEAIRTGKLKRGMLTLLLGFGAGLSLGGIILRY